MTQPKPIPKSYEELVRNVENGVFQIPKFQRDFVWSKAQVAKLLDSIIKGYPIGTFILWKTKDRLKSLKKIGGSILKTPPEGDYVYYILDGQQRITSLYLAIKGIEISDGNSKGNYKEIYVNLSEAVKWMKDKEYESEIITENKPENGKWITFYDFMNKSVLDIADEYGMNIAKLVESLKGQIQNYQFSTIEIEELPLSRVAEIFTRINTTGTELTLFEIMNAKMYEEGRFDLEDEYDKLIEDLKQVGYETIAENRTIILQLASLIINESAKKRDVLNMDKEDFIDAWPNIVSAVKLAIEKLKLYYRIPVSKLLPYYVLIVPLAYLYYINGLRDDLTPSQLREFEIYLFRSAFTNRFSSAVESKLTMDIKIMEKIKKGEPIEWDKEIPFPYNRDVLMDWIMNKPFSTSNSIDKGVLCILAYHEPRRFNDNSKVLLDNSWLNISTSKNYHHIFPKAFLKKQGFTKEEANVLANITFVDDFLNKRVIKSKPPSQYLLKEFKKDNTNIEETLKTHLIDDVREFGIVDDDYKKFREMRAARIVNEMLHRVGKDRGLG